MGRLIDADELAKTATRSLIENPHTHTLSRQNHHTEHEHFLSMIATQPTAYNAIQNCMKAVEDAPAVEAIHVVRCKECQYARPVKHRGEVLENIFRCSYLRPNTNMFDIDYCRYGRKKVQDGKVD